MNDAEASLVRAEIEAANHRADQAEAAQRRAEADRDRLRALLSRLRTSMSEAFNDPGQDGTPPGGAE